MFQRYALSLLLTIALCTRDAREGVAQNLPRYDFTQAAQVREWRPAHDVARLVAEADGMRIDISGSDPYLQGPARDFPSATPLWMKIRLKSPQSGMGQVFYFSPPKPINEADSVRFAVPGGKWVEVRVPMPALGPKTYLRLDPPGTKGSVTVALIEFSPRILLQPPAWPAAVAPNLTALPYQVRSGDLELRHNGKEIGGWEVRVGEYRMALGSVRPLIGYLLQGTTHWLPLAEKATVKARQEKTGLVVEAEATDAQGGLWRFQQQFRASRRPGGIEVETQVTVSQPREVVFLPLLLLHPGKESFGEGKKQALFAGLEYLDGDEPSSSEKDILGPGAMRQIPDNLKITIPLMAIQAEDRYLGLTWEKAPHIAALFDTPDRIYRSGGHLMGLLFPGSDGLNREEGNLLPYEGEKLVANRPLILKATLLGGRGKSVIPAVQEYVARHGLPPTPKPVASLEDYTALATAGWLDSKIYERDHFRHAYPGDFASHPAADAGLMLHWLALQTTDAPRKERLRTASQQAIAQVPPPDLNFSAVGHVTAPVAALVYGHTAENVAKAAQAGYQRLPRFEADGTLLYRKTPNGPDYGKTHFAPEANGHTAPMLLGLMESALISGDTRLSQESIRLLRAMDKFAHTAPRGAQTWEIPLHTPDILASAFLLRAYLIGYELTGEDHFLQQARYWAWTGVPFLYLEPPTSNPIGLYATVPVLGATQWIAPNWMGLPVQWCGLVYSAALYRLSRYADTPLWKQIADGITASGIQQTWPLGSDPHRPGLLPDSFNLKAQIRNDPAINPATLLTNALSFYRKPPLYDYAVGRKHRLIVHAPGAIRVTTDTPQQLTFTVQAWPDTPYHLLIVGLKSTPQVRLNGKPITLTPPHHYLPTEGRLLLRVQGQPKVEISRQ